MRIYNKIMEMLEGTAKLWEIHGSIPNQIKQSIAIDGVNGAETVWRRGEGQMLDVNRR